MNRHLLICRTISEHSATTQRNIAAILDSSLGTANRLLHECIEYGYLTADAAGYQLTDEGRSFLNKYKVDNAVILAAGFGSRFVPLTFETPKGLLEVFHERMIERQIRQLHEAGVCDITIVVGYLKEKFEYLIDKFGVKLLYNPEYRSKNSLSSLYHARHLLQNTYLLSSDNWLRDNMYHAYEPGAWYSAPYAEGETAEWSMQADKKGRVTHIAVGGSNTHYMYGPVYFDRAMSGKMVSYLEEYYNRPGTENFYWEQILLDHVKDITFYLNKQPGNQVYEFENLEELREFDARYQNHSDNAAMECVAKAFGIREQEITNIRCLKAGMTNKSFVFEVAGKQYICRIPGPGTGLLINRRQEKNVYETIAPLNISERILYFDGDTGFKISDYYENTWHPDQHSWDDMGKCMDIVRQLHHSGLTVEHSFDIRERISFYESLCRGNNCLYFEDYGEVKAQMDQLMDRLEALNPEKMLTHIDSNVDNFLFLPSGDIRLIDWEYSGMCDPLLDISMSAIYCYYDEEELDTLSRLYLGQEPSEEERFRIYSYAALGGFLWALWAIYKESFGEEFGEYTIDMYRYAKKYFRKISKELGNML